MAGNGKVDYKEGINLLDGGSSDSDTQEHYAMPPLDLKKGNGSFGSPKHQKVRTRSGSQGCCCSPLLVLSLFGLSALTVALAVVALYTYHLKVDVRGLQAQLASMTKANAEGKFTDLYSEYDKLTSGLSDLRSGDDGTETLGRHILLMQDQMKLLNATSENLKQHVKDLDSRIAKMPKLAQLPDVVDVLQKTVADQGSNMASLQNTIDEMHAARNELTKRLDALELEGTKEDGGRSADQPNTDNTAETQQALLTLNTFMSDVDHWNKSLSSQLNVMMTHSQQHLVSIQDLQNKTSLLDNRLSLVELRGGVTDSALPKPVPDMELIVQEAVTSVLEELKNFTKDERKSVDEVALQNITDRIDQLAVVVDMMKQSLKETPPVAGSSSGSTDQFTNFTARLTELRASLEMYKTTGDADFQLTNSTIWSVERRVGTLETSLSDLSMRVVEIQEALQEYRTLEPTDNNKNTPPPMSNSQLQSDENGINWEEGGGGRHDSKEENALLQPPDTDDKTFADITEESLEKIREKIGDGSLQWPSLNKTESNEDTDDDDLSEMKSDEDDYDDDYFDDSYYDDDDYDSDYYTSRSSEQGDTATVPVSTTTTRPSNTTTTTARMSTSPMSTPSGKLAPSQTSTTTTSSASSTEPLIQMGTIQKVEDLIASFMSWDSNGDGYLQMDELNNALGPVPPELAAYDTDRDGQFTLEELNPAFGFAPVQPPPDGSNRHSEVPFIPEEAESEKAELPRQKRRVKNTKSLLEELFDNI